jgi:hypothetical protein
MNEFHYPEVPGRMFYATILEHPFLVLLADAEFD